MQTSGVVVAALLAASGLAAPAPALPGHVRPGPAATLGGRHSLQAKRNPTFKRNGPLALAKAHLKFGKEVPPKVAAAVAKTASVRRRATGSAANTPTQFDTEYLVPVSIGTPPQQFNLDIDTGSSDLWVFSTETSSNEIDGQSQYNAAASSTSQQLKGNTFSISYGDGSDSSGNVFTDDVSIGSLTVPGQGVEAAEKVSATFTQDSASDGLMGLAFSTLNTVTPTQQKTFFDNAQANLDAPLFTVDLQHDANGTYNFGFIDDTAFTGDIAFTPVDSSQGFWGFTATGFAVGSGASTSANIAGIADTGTTLMLLPSNVVSAYYKQVSGAQDDQQAGGFVFPCSSTLPDFSFNVGNGTTTVPGSFINFEPVDETGETCFGGLQSDAGIGMAIFGDVALKSAFVVFDGGNNQLGWASKTLPAAPATSTTVAQQAAAGPSSGSGSGKKGHKHNN